MKDLENSNSPHLVDAKETFEGRRNQTINFYNAQNDSCDEIEIFLHDGHKLSISADGIVNDDGTFEVWLEPVMEKRK